MLSAKMSVIVRYTYTRVGSCRMERSGMIQKQEREENERWQNRKKKKHIKMKQSGYHGIDLKIIINFQI